MDLAQLFIVFIFVVIGILLWQNAGTRERALGLAAKYCESQDVQLLDQSVALVSMSLSKDGRGNLAIGRRYEFEFTSTGEQRYKGRLKLHGQRLKDSELDPHRMSAGHDTDSIDTQTPQQPSKRDRSHLRGL